MSSGKQGRLFENKAIKYMEALGHRILGIDRRPSKNLARGGWPDIISVIEGKVHVWEIKSGDSHEVHDHQREVLKALQRLGAIVHTVRYSDSDSEPKDTILEWVDNQDIVIETIQRGINILRKEFGLSNYDIEDVMADILAEAVK